MILLKKNEIQLTADDVANHNVFEAPAGNLSSWLRALAVSLLGMGQVTLLISLPVLVADTGLGYDIFTGLVALGTFLFIFFAPVWGKLSDKYGRKPVVLAGLAGIMISNAMVVLIIKALMSDIISTGTAMTGLILSRVIYGVLVSGLYPAVQAWTLSNCQSKDSINKLSQVTSAISLGRLAGPLLPLLFLSSGSTTPLAFIAALSALLLFLMSFSKEAFQPTQPNNTPTSLSVVKNTLNNLWPALLLAVSVTTLFGLLQYLIAPILQQRFEFTAQNASELLSLLMMLAAAATVVSHLTVLQLLKNNPMVALQVGSVLILIGCLVLITAGTITLLTTGVSLCAAAVTLLTPVYTSIAAKQLPNRQGTITGSLSMIHTAGYTLGALLAGLVGMPDSPILTVVTLFVAFLILLISFFLIEPEKNKTHAIY
ncbi:hypothetical protein EOPP23_08575 [Endozoicomonas sp. OPT23]|uniref:MFS transporter n=1 Tax=Endozoicomonas sp. OPT23 TaxID=2072845 RepID=UPI00129BF2D9|nr:MFS transporter [Endozoicomonas sp. OPT23]MRI33036.1 hypothetical protein [Endozoicomonas sp. OPT23]